MRERYRRPNSAIDQRLAIEAQIGGRFDQRRQTKEL
jgi:hypothetical protein